MLQVGAPTGTARFLGKKLTGTNLTLNECPCTCSGPPGAVTCTLGPNAP
jgi:hypothetical protein